MIQAAVAKYLAERGHGTYGQAGADLFLERLPAEPADATAVYVKPAPPGDYSDHQPVGLQIIVRRSPAPGGGDRTRRGYDDAVAIRAELHGLRHITLDEAGPDETRVVWLRADDARPTNLGDDTNGVPRWSLRFIAEERLPVTDLTML
jgi:hypothetical protein